VPQQPEFAVCLCRGVIFDTSDFTPFLVDLPYQGRSAIVTLQDRCEQLEYHPLFGGKDFRLGDREFRRHKHPAVGRRICRCEQQKNYHYRNRDLHLAHVWALFERYVLFGYVVRTEGSSVRA
jgi:hypothetical protein